MSIIQAIEAKLTQAFAPTHLELINDSHKHAGHAGQTHGESHVGIIIVSDAFTGMGRIERHRAVHAAIAQEIPLFHAITVLKPMTVAEFKKTRE